MEAAPDSRYLYVSDRDQARVIKLDLCTLQYIEVTVPSQPADLALSPDETKLYVAKSGATSVAVVDTATWTVETTWDLSGNVPYDIEATSERLYIAANVDHDAALVIVDTSDGSIIDVHTDNWNGNTRLIEVDPVRGKLYAGVVGWSPSNLSRWNIFTETVGFETECGHGDLGSNGQNLTLSPDGTHILFMVGGGNGTGYTVYNTQALSDQLASRDGEYDIGTYPHDMVYHPDGEKVYGICGSYYDGTIKILNTSTQVREGVIEVGIEGDRLCMNGDGSMLIMSAGQDLHIFNLGYTCPATPTPPPTSTPTPSITVTPTLTPPPSPTPSRSPVPTSSPTPEGYKTSTPTPTPGPLPWVYDYDGDGTSDIGIFRPSSGLWAIRGITRAYWGRSGDEPVPGDYDGNSITDLACYRSSTGYWFIKDVTKVFWGKPNSDLPAAGDFDGDGSTDIGVYRNSSGLWLVRGVTRAYWGRAGGNDEPLPGDYSGDGTAEIGCYRPSTGYWFIKDLTKVFWGLPNDDLPAPGGYGGERRWVPAIFRQTSGFWSVRGGIRTYWGRPGDIPVPGDYLGYGRDQIGAFRPSTGYWFIKDVTKVFWGKSGDVPVTR